MFLGVTAYEHEENHLCSPSAASRDKQGLDLGIAYSSSRLSFSLKKSPQMVLSKASWRACTVVQYK